MTALAALLVLMDMLYSVGSDSTDSWATHSCRNRSQCGNTLKDLVPDESVVLLQADFHVRSTHQDYIPHATMPFLMALVAVVVVCCTLCAVACWAKYSPSTDKENKRNFAVTPNIATLAANLGEHPPVQKGTETDFLTLVDTKNRNFLEKLSSEYMSILSGDGEADGGNAWSWMTTNPLRNLKYSEELIASVEAADRLLKWSIANPKFNMMLNAHRYIVENVINAPENARLSDKATVELLFVFALMAVSVAPLSGKLALKKGNGVFAEGRKLEKFVPRARERLMKKDSLLAETTTLEEKQLDGDSDSDNERHNSHEKNASTSIHAVESSSLGIDDRLASKSLAQPSILGIDPAWFTDDIADHAMLVKEVSQHLKMVEPNGRGEWLESRTMCFYTSFLTDVVATMRIRMHHAQSMQAKLIGVAATLGFTVLNLLMKAIADRAKSEFGF